MIELNKKVFETERLVLRPFSEADLYDLYDYASVPETAEMAGWKYHGNIEDSKIILSMLMKGKNVYAIELLENDKVIGSLGLSPRGEGLELGYVISISYWGKGLEIEAFNAIIDYCFNDLGVEEVYRGYYFEHAVYDTINNALGFKVVGKDLVSTLGLGKKERVLSVLKRDEWNAANMIAQETTKEEIEDEEVSKEKILEEEKAQEEIIEEKAQEEIIEEKDIEEQLKELVQEQLIEEDELDNFVLIDDFEKALAEKFERLDSLEEIFTEKFDSIETREAEFLEKLNTKEEALNDKIKEIEEKEDSLKEKISDLAEKDKILSERTEEVKASEKALSERMEEVKASEKTLSERMEEVKASEKTLSERMEEVKASEKALSERMEEVKASEKALSEKVEEIKASEKALLERMEKIKDSEKDLSERIEEVELQQKALLERQEELESREDFVNEQIKSLEEKEADFELSVSKIATNQKVITMPLIASQQRQPFTAAPSGNSFTANGSLATMPMGLADAETENSLDREPKENRQEIVDLLDELLMEEAKAKTNNIKFRRILNSKVAKNKVKNLYKKNNGRFGSLSFAFILAKAKSSGADIFAAYDEDKFVGFTYVVYSKKKVTVPILCVNDSDYRLSIMEGIKRLSANRNIVFMFKPE